MSEISRMIAKVNEMAVDREAMDSYYPNLSASAFKNIIDSYTSMVKVILKNAGGEIVAFRADKARRFMKKLMLLVNEKWLHEGAKLENEEVRIA